MASSDRERLVASLYDQQRVGAVRAVLFHAAMAARAGLNITDVSCLGILDKEGPMTAGQIAEHMGLTRGGSITAVLDRMERAGLVQRRPDPDDRRRAVVELIREEPYQSLQSVLNDFGNVFMELIDEYSDDEIRTLLEFTHRANELMQERTRELKSQGSRRTRTRKT